MIPTKSTIEEYPEDFEELTPDERRRYYQFDYLLNQLSKIKSPGVDTNFNGFRENDIFAFTSDKYAEIKDIINEMKQVLKGLGFKLIIKELDVDDVDISYRDSDQIAFSKSIIDKYNYELTSVNFGGGFGIPYVSNDKPIDKKLTTNKMIELIESLGNEIGFNPTDIYIEPGRSVLGNSCVTLYTCGDFKHTYGDKNYQFIDGGMTDNIRPALYQAEYSCDVVNKMNDEKNVVCDIAGKCCESGDIIIQNAQLPKTSNGDVLMVYSTGAYNYTMSSNYNSLLRPAVLLVGDEVKVLKRRQTLDDLI